MNIPQYNNGIFNKPIVIEREGRNPDGQEWPIEYIMTNKSKEGRENTSEWGRGTNKKT